jgi:NADH dehydrogenase
LITSINVDVDILSDISYISVNTEIKENEKMNKQNKKLKILVLGGNGFIGNKIVENLAKNAEVTIGTRNNKPKDNELTIRMQSLHKVSAWKVILQGFDVVINSVGILRERTKESYEDVHYTAVDKLAQACASLNIQMLHVSAIGLSANARSRFIRSKYAGEQAIIASGAKATIIRPSLLDGEGGYGAKWFRRVAAWPIQFVMKSEGLVAPLHVADLGEAMAKLVFMYEKKRPAIIELGGVGAYSIPGYLTYLRKRKGYAKAIQITVPKLLVRWASHLFDVMAWTPLSFGHYELMQGYNVPSINLLPTLLERNPMKLGEENTNFGGDAALLKAKRL